MCVSGLVVLTLTHQLENVTHTLNQLKAVNGGCVIDSLIHWRSVLANSGHDGAFLLNTVVACGRTSTSCYHGCRRLHALTVPQVLQLNC